MTASETEERRLALEEHRLSEELRLKARELDLREQELTVQREQFDATNRGSWKQVYSPLGVAILAGLLGLAANLVTGRQNLAVEREKQRSDRELQMQKQKADEILERRKQQTTLLIKLAEQSDHRQRARNLLFFAEGGYLTFSEQYQMYLRKTAGLQPDQQVPPPSFGELVPIPPSSSATPEPAKTATLMELLGKPCTGTQQCNEPTNPKLNDLLVSDTVGSIRLRGLRPAVAAVKRVLEAVSRQDPDLFAQIRSQGMLCCRLNRGSVSFSAHSWGTAVDLSIGDKIAPFGSNKAQYGITLIAPLFEAEGFAWGAGETRGRESYHFAVSEQTIREWQASGLLQ